VFLSAIDAQAGKAVLDKKAPELRDRASPGLPAGVLLAE